MTEPHFGETEWQLEILYVDHFGNLLLNATADLLSGASLAKMADNPRVTIRFDGQNRSESATFVSNYSCLPPGNLVLLEGSNGRLELAVNNGNAAKQLSAKPGNRITVRFHEG
jgi:S-adenosylmethionine hydrolase